MKPLIIAAALLLAGPLHAAELPVPVTATAAQWRDIRTLTAEFWGCGGTTPGNIRACAHSGRLQEKLMKQGFCFYKRLIVGKIATSGPEEDRGPAWTKDGTYCYTLRDPR